MDISPITRLTDSITIRTGKLKEAEQHKDHLTMRSVAWELSKDIEALKTILESPQARYAQTRLDHRA